MDPLTSKVATSGIGAFLKKVGELAVDQYDDWRLSSRVSAGEDIAHEGTLRALVQEALQRLVSRPGRLPPTFGNPDILAWLLTAEFLDPFIWVVVATGNGQQQDGGLARKFLAAQYSKVTGDSERTAEGTINIVASVVVGKLQLGEKRKVAFNQALSRLLNSGFQRYFQAELRPNPSEFDLYRLRELARALIETGRTNWKMPAFIAPFVLEAAQKTKNAPAVPVNTTVLVSGIQRGSRTVISGPGGIGKTTYLLQLATEILAHRRAGIPIYVDAVTWAQSNQPILDFVANGPAARIQFLSASDLTWFAKGGHLVLMVNGWNEIPASKKSHLQMELNSLLTTLPDLPIVIVSRTPHDAGNLEDPREIEVIGITWRGQQEIIRNELDATPARDLTERIERDGRLLLAAKSPLILRGLISRARNGLSASTVVFDLLGSVVQELEEHVAYKPVLNAAPTHGVQRFYLEELACAMTNQRTVQIAEVDAFTAISKGFQRISHAVGTSVSFPQVLETLGNHHLINVQGNQVRFAHQRIQEYYAASRILEICAKEPENTAMLQHMANEPYWNDALNLVSEKLKTSVNTGLQRGLLVQSALSVDLLYACELAGRTGLQRADAPDLYDQIWKKLDELSMSPVNEVADLAVSGVVLSQFPEFKTRIWQALEAEDSASKHTVSRLISKSLSVSQLGDDVLKRVINWSGPAQIGLMFELSETPENYEFLLEFAKVAPDHEVRRAALTALLWSYPASPAAIEIWLSAPLTVAAHTSVLADIRYAYEQGVESQRIRERLSCMAREHISDEQRLYIFANFPGALDAVPIEAVFRAISQERSNQEPLPMVNIALEHAPERLYELAIDTLFDGQRTPNWTAAIFPTMPGVKKHAVFERALQSLGAGTIPRSDFSKIALLANHDDIRDCISQILKLISSDVPISESDRKVLPDLEDILRFVDGSLLYEVVLEQSKAAGYSTSVRLIRFITNRHEDDVTPRETQFQWKVTSEQLKSLLKAFSSKRLGPNEPTAELHILLAQLAADIAPTEHEQLILLALDQHLAEFRKYYAAMNAWERDGNPRLRPHLPAMSGSLMQSITKLGYTAVPKLLQKIHLPEAADVIPTTLQRITMGPWLAKRKGVSISVSGRIAEGLERQDAGQAMQQPDGLHQQATDEIAHHMAELLQRETKAAKIREAADPKNKITSRGRVGIYAKLLASIPSAHVIEPSKQVLCSGLLDSWQFIDVMKELLMNGWNFEDEDVFRALEQKIETATTSLYKEEEVICTLYQLAFSVTSLHVLSHSPSHYLTQWQTFSYPSKIVRVLGESKTSYAWNILLQVEKLATKHAPNRDEIGMALCKSLSRTPTESILPLLEDRTIFSLFRTSWMREEFASSLLLAAHGGKERVETILSTLRNTACLDGDDFEYAILQKLGEDDETILHFGLTAADAGRANDDQHPAFRALLNLASYTEPLSGNIYEITPKACDALRKELYSRASKNGVAMNGARLMLAAIEAKRRENGRPAQEQRHPFPTEGTSWTDVLLLPEASSQAS
ncbi:hypothetical protein [Herbaspirillum sp. C9C3]|uniref:NACHT domain-containing protein n=1 Tax=Herbaspirillum sp. C9C3 TaxID=2735271 RepID=UPI001585220C|nr:hypothetical protein [Herbaspirillum sp. C9C3]NUT60763.1 hypothetical protein [Herbaspirillum sp. C9C3]